MSVGVYLPITPHSAAIFERGTRSIPLKATQSFKKGAPLVSNGGYYEEAGAAPATVAYIAAEDATSHASDGGASCIAWPVTVDDLWEASFEDAYAIADNLGNYGLVKDATTGFWFVDEGDAGDQITSYGPQVTPSLGAVGDTKFRGLIKFQAANIAGY